MGDYSDSLIMTQWIGSWSMSVKGQSFLVLPHFPPHFHHFHPKDKTKFLWIASSLLTRPHQRFILNFFNFFGGDMTFYCWWIPFWIVARSMMTRENALGSTKHYPVEEHLQLMRLCFSKLNCNRHTDLEAACVNYWNREPYIDT